MRKDLNENTSLYLHSGLLSLDSALVSFLFGSLPCELPESYSLLIRQKEHTMTYTKKVKRWHFPVALEFSFVAQRNGSSLLSMFSNQLLDEYKLLLLFFHLDSVLILYTIIRHHDEKKSWRKIDSWKTVLARKQLRRAKIRTPEIKQPLKTTKDAQMIKKILFISFVNNAERDRYKVAPTLLIIPYIVTIFLYKKDTTHRNVFISLFPFFLLARITRIYNTSMYKRFARVFSLRRNWSRWKKWLPAERTSRFSRPLTKNAAEALSEKDGCMKKCQSTQKQTVFWVFFSVYCLRKIVQGAK